MAKHKRTKGQIMKLIQNTIIMMTNAGPHDRKYFDLLLNRLARLQGDYIKAGGSPDDKPFEDIAQNDK